MSGKQIYCVKCKAPTPTSDLSKSTSSKGQPMVKGKCTKCGTKKTTFVSKKGGEGFLDSIMSLFG